MPAKTNVYFQGKSGRKGKPGKRYKYEAYQMNWFLPASGGNYVVFKRLKNGRPKVLYVGETTDFSERFGDHHKMECMKQQGATHIAIRVHRGGKSARLREEKDLIDRYNPPCNG